MTKSFASSKDFKADWILRLRIEVGWKLLPCWVELSVIIHLRKVPDLFWPLCQSIKPPSSKSLRRDNVPLFGIAKAELVSASRKTLTRTGGMTSSIDLTITFFKCPDCRKQSDMRRTWSNHITLYLSFRRCEPSGVTIAARCCKSLQTLWKYTGSSCSCKFIITQTLTNCATWLYSTKSKSSFGSRFSQ